MPVEPLAPCLAHSRDLVKWQVLLVALGVAEVILQRSLGGFLFSCLLPLGNGSFLALVLRGSGVWF